MKEELEQEHGSTLITIVNLEIIIDFQVFFIEDNERFKFGFVMKFRHIITLVVNFIILSTFIVNVFLFFIGFNKDL